MENRKRNFQVSERILEDSSRKNLRETTDVPKELQPDATSGQSGFSFLGLSKHPSIPNHYFFLDYYKILDSAIRTSFDS